MKGPTNVSNAGANGQAPYVPSRSHERWAHLAEVTPAEKPINRKRKSEIALPIQITSLVPESMLYMRLFQFERRLDATLENKVERIKHAMEEVYSELDGNAPLYANNFKVNLYLRFEENTKTEEVPADGEQTQDLTLYVYGTVDNLSQALLDKHKGSEQQDENASKESSKTTKLSQILKKVTIQGLIESENNIATKLTDYVWNSGEVTEESSDCFRIDCSRFQRGSQLKVTLEFKDQPERYQVTPALGKTIGISTGTKSQIYQALWPFLKIKGMQSSSETSIIEVNPKLKNLLGESSFKLSALSFKLQKFLQPLKPLSFYVEVPVKGAVSDENIAKMATIEVKIPVNLKSETKAFLDKLKEVKVLNVIEEEIKQLIGNINERKRRRTFFLGFSHSPVDFITSLIGSQQRDLKMLQKYQTESAGSYVKRSHLFKDAWAHDAVVRYLHQKIASGTAD